MNKYAIIACALLFSTLCSCQDGLNFTSYRQVMKGYLLGLTVKEGDTEALLKCLYEDEKVQADFVTYMNKIDKLDFNNLPLTAELFADLYETMTYSVLMIDQCSHNYPEYARIFGKIYHMMKPTLIKRLMLNFVSNPQAIFKDIQDAVDNYLLARFQRLGQDLGEIMHMIVTFASHELSPDDILLLLKGFFEGMNINSEFQEILKCIEGTPAILSKVAEIVKILKNIDFSKLELILQAVMKVFSLGKEILKDLESCSGSISELKKILTKLLKIDLLQLAEYIISHLSQILVTVKSISEAFGAGKYEECGKLFGTLVYRIFLDQTLIGTE